MGFIYLCLLLFIIIFILYLLRKNNKVSPKKIRPFIAISLIPLLIRYLALIGGVVIEKQSIFYWLRGCILLYYFSIPLLIIVCLYVFLRDERIKFNTNYIFMIPLMLVFTGINAIYKFNININNTFGFVVTLENGLVPILIYLIILASLTVFNLLYVDKPYSNKSGMKLLLFSLVVCVMEYILFLGGIKVFPYSIIGETLVLVTVLKAIGTFK
ncbi:hypothetical protein JCM1393_04830 [Clostridium carnis]